MATLDWANRSAVESIPGKVRVKQLALIKQSLQSVLVDCTAAAALVEPLTVPRIVHADPDDDHALAARADLIVSGDNDLLTLGHYRDIPILLPSVAMTSVMQRS